MKTSTNSFNKLALLGIALTLLAACSKDESIKPAALTNFVPTTTINKQWTASTSANKTTSLKLTPAFANNNIFIASPNGEIKAIDKNTGKTAWQTDTKMPLSSGLAANSNMIFIGTGDGDVLALQQQSGKIVWQTTVSNDILASPAVNDTIVVVKTSTGHLSAFDATNGKPLWTYNHPASSLTLRGSSSPIIMKNTLISGFANGEIVAIDLENGSILWKQQIATPTGNFTIERMVDIIADPVIADNIIYVAAYQGNIAAINAKSGHIIWQQPISCYSGLTVGEHNVYITDTQDKLWVFDRTNGAEIWHKEGFTNRGLSGPAVLNNLVAVGDTKGYVHWLNIKNGQFSARSSVGGSIVVSPIINDNAIYVLSNNGSLVKFSTDIPLQTDIALKTDIPPQTSVPSQIDVPRHQNETTKLQANVPSKKKVSHHQTNISQQSVNKIIIRCKTKPNVNSTHPPKQ